MKHKKTQIATGLLAAVAVLALALAGGVLAQDGDDTPEPDDEGADVEYTWSGDVNAPDFPPDAEWINASAPIRMEDLRGKIVMLDFWTYGCINCIHIIPDLKRLEAEYPEELVVIGVHSAKFESEGETENIRQIVRRYEVEHPVINDNDFTVWNAYGVRAWPTVMVIDPFGKVVGQLSGEPLYPRIAPVIEVMAKEYSAAGAINPEPLAQWQPEEIESDTPLLFPGKVLADPAGNRLFISDSNHNRLIVTALDTFDVLEIIGSGEPGLQDGDYATAQFFRPQGLTLMGDMLYVADTENHAIRAVNLTERTVETVAGTGAQEFNYDRSGPGVEVALNSPWDVVAHEGKVYIAMAGQHQLWVLDVERGNIVSPFAGTGREALFDAPRDLAALNQPSGLDTDGTVLYIADSEASAIRTADLGPDGRLSTIVGTGLFDFGDVDGTGDEVLLQHPLGVTVADDGYLYIADTYNNKIKRIDPVARTSETFVGTGDPGAADGITEAQFYEPGGLDYANGKLYVADTNNHAIRIIDVATGEVSTVEFPNAERLLGDAAVSVPPAGLEPPSISAPEGGIPSVLGSADPNDGRVEIPAQTVSPGEGTIRVNITMPEGYKFNNLAPFTAIWADNSLVSIPDEWREYRTKEPVMPLDIPATFSEGQTELSVDLDIYWCEAVNETLCFVKQAELVVPLTVDDASENKTVEMAYGLVPPVVNTNTFQ